MVSTFVFASSSSRGPDIGKLSRQPRNGLVKLRARYFKSATQSLISANFVLYGLQCLSRDQLTLALMKTGEGIMKRGEVWRLATCCFMHGSPMHLIVNMQSLYNLGAGLESFSGKARFLCVYAAGGICSSLTSLFLTPNPSVGASGAIMGLAGAQLVFNLRHKGHFTKEMDPILDQATQSMLISLGITLAFGLYSKHIDNWGHLGGFIGGAITAWLLGPDFNQRGNRLVDSPPWPILARPPIHKR